MIYTNNDQAIKEFKKILIEKGIQQQAVADLLGMSKQAFSNFLKKKNLSFQDMQRLLNCIGYDLEFGFIEKPPI